MSKDHHLTLTQVRTNLIATLPPHPSDSTIDTLQERILTRIDQPAENKITGVILDVEGVQTVDSFFARTIVETAKMVELMGAKPILVGISPPIAITATELGFSLSDVDTALSTDGALEMLSTEQNAHDY
jgi:rsbT antagonist protein RsbS